MNSDFWKQFAIIPGFDCLKMKHEIQANIHEETKHMTQEQRLEYYRSGAKKLRRHSRVTTPQNEPLFVKEKSASYSAKAHRKD